MSFNNNNYQAGTDSGVTAGSFVVLTNTLGNTFDGSFRVYGLVGGTQTFEVHIEITADGTTWTPLKKITSAAGPDATYTQAAEIDIYCASNIRIRAKNTSVSSANFIHDIRSFQAGWR